MENKIHYHSICKKCKEQIQDGKNLIKPKTSGTSGAGDMCIFCGSNLMPVGISGTTKYKKGKNNGKK